MAEEEIWLKKENREVLEIHKGKNNRMGKNRSKYTLIYSH